MRGVFMVLATLAVFSFAHSVAAAPRAAAFDGSRIELVHEQAPKTKKKATKKKPKQTSAPSAGQKS